MNGEDPPERPDYINDIINGLERYNPEAVSTLEAYLGEQCEQKFCDCNANRTLLKLYQLNPERTKDEIITNILVLSLTQFPSPQFSLNLHLLNPSSVAAAAAPASELSEAVAKLRSLSAHLESAQYAAFWSALDGDDLCADLIADISGFEDLVRSRIAGILEGTYREMPLRELEAWLGLEGDAARRWIAEVGGGGGGGWTVDEARGVVVVPRNVDNEAKKAEVRETVSVDMFSRMIRRAWEETV